ncbi:MAG: ATP synthase F1 subunit delta [Candidatus Magasanikbacteria bacterium RIFCSPHIGHO2_01_FULL_33_34]|uniref:ATP synthase F1 subunit delta n=1 Tax=Candidatus Magasanikbacteria bacterium RIFCSPHIGHO2_01_FULL_33_34 TaxID=1798671 RepID=A0A1F6LLA9_9BACT|nr:MAG: ATP synthase F1 subunit delta [Candidatus Magasanikbacteria bacterium RIFCSPHIGHO2_01_FULL_33_34]OGH65844.1 MAG: ATP synthase F1 subunit delta [Candidatus Magasanikbacteria bacterium RIFCSPHIGHO2_02_FULL_33_17]OGH75209.1 MAG: ATP synthase F1 subunit delta [Candidatus Magasanikbacteria bacterium RIFCSPLOWO2_01_FULL_33_34]OGH82232.1 MAG: ATP synthase F1 subunit delta [Candidatus Magasanikbacteria bacterium RIFCSPLOWO2_12_FULL_34_7]
MKLSPKSYGRVLYEVTKNEKGENLEKIVEHFFLLLSHDQMLTKINYIIEEFIAYAKEMSGVTKLEITSARELSNVEIKKISKHFGDKVEADLKIDKTILGGLKIKNKNIIMDASLKNQLNKLKNQLA